MKIKIYNIIFLIISILILIFIFVMSSQDGSASSAQSSTITTEVVEIVKPNYDTLPEPEKKEVFDFWHYLIRKGAHVSEYLALAISLLLGFYFIKKKFILVPSLMLFTFICAMLDEFHQTFVGGRAGQMSDVGIDMIGVFAFYVLFIIIYGFLYYNKNKKIKAAQL